MAVIATSSTAAIGTEMYLRDAEVAEREADADELGDDRQEVQEEQVADREPAPEAPEALVDQARVADAGDGAEAHDHLLVDDQHRDQQQQHPQQAGAVVLARPASRSRRRRRRCRRPSRSGPGPTIASSASARARQLRRAPVSCWPIVPNAPWMSPTWALSSTARSRARRRCGVIVVGHLLLGTPLRRLARALAFGGLMRRGQATTGQRGTSRGRRATRPRTSRGFAVFVSVRVVHGRSSGSRTSARGPRGTASLLAREPVAAAPIARAA